MVFGICGSRSNAKGRHRFQMRKFSQGAGCANFCMITQGGVCQGKGSRQASGKVRALGEVRHAICGEKCADVCMNATSCVRRFWQSGDSRRMALGVQSMIFGTCGPSSPWEWLAHIPQA